MKKYVLLAVVTWLILATAGCGGGGNNQSSLPATGLTNVVLPQAVLIASQRTDGSIGFYDPITQSLLTSDTLWTQYEQGVASDLTTQAIGLPNRGETATPQFYLVITTDHASIPGAHKLDCQVFSALAVSGVSFSITVNPTQSPPVRITYPSVSILDPTYDQSINTDEQSLRNLVNISLFHYLGKNTSPLDQSYTPAIAAAVSKTYDHLYAMN